MSSVDISVIIPVKNGAAVIGEQLGALAAQQFDGTWEVVISDNGSTDNLLEVVEAHRHAFPTRLRVADASHRAGISAARNAGALAAEGELLLFCDCDDHVAPGWLAAAWDARQPDTILAGQNRVLETPFRVDSPVLNPGGVIRGIKSDGFIGCNFAVPRDTYLKVGGFDESLPTYGCDDMEFAIRCSKSGIPVEGAPEMQLYFHRTEGMKTLLRKTFLSGKAEVVVWHRHLDRFGDEVGLRRAVLRLIRLPFDLVAGRHPFNPRRVARSLVTRWAHAVAAIEWHRGRYERQPRLLTSIREAS